MQNYFDNTKYTKKGRGIAPATIVKNIQNDLKNITHYNQVPQNFTLTCSDNLQQLRQIAQNREVWYLLGTQVYDKYLQTYNISNERQRDTRRRHQERNILQEEENIRQQLATIQQRRAQIRQALVRNAPRTAPQDQEEIQNNRIRLANNTHVRNREMKNRKKKFNIFGNGIPIILHRHRTRQNSNHVDNNEVCQRLNMN
jgi:hypothetical protein